MCVNLLQYFMIEVYNKFYSNKFLEKEQIGFLFNMKIIITGFRIVDLTRTVVY